MLFTKTTNVIVLLESIELCIDGEKKIHNLATNQKQKQKYILIIIKFKKEGSCL